MNHEQQGIRIKDERGKPILEVGPHTMRSHPKFAEQIGIITAYWAQAEANLNCLFAILLETTPEQAYQQLKKHRSAASATKGARALATENLSGAELNSVLEALDKLDEARAQRNRVQHDIWALKGVDIERLFTIHTDQYFNFVIELMTLSEKSESTTIEDYITSAVKFAAAVSNSYTIADLQFIAQEIDIASQLVLKVMFSIRLARGNS
ncbi:MAG: hypothetical protein IJF82_03010 [Achromobacter sp.]|nr:hypothetical protein [Achromobacter sp.]